jgi:hypothetical protein
MNNLASSQPRRRAQHYVALFFEISVALIIVPLLVHGLLAVNALPVA